MRFPKGDQIDNPVRAKYEQIAQNEGNQAVWDILHNIDPKSAEILHVNNTRRVIRALEMHAQGISYADQVKNIKQLPEVVPSLRFGLKRDPKILADRINERVDKMVEQGLIEEVQTLLNSGFRSALTAPQAIGYKEFFPYFEGKISLEEAVDTLKKETRHYAKRQMTWFNNKLECIKLDGSKPKNELVDEILKFI